MLLMQDIIRTPEDLALALRAARGQRKLKATEVARNAGRSRNILHRLEHGDDATVSALLDVVAALGMALRLEATGLPTLEEMNARFAQLDDDDGAA